MNLIILSFDSIDSTNTEAIKQAKRGADEGLCVVASKQTGGRGRLGRKWVSEPDGGLYFSIVLRPKIELKFLPLLTLMTAVVIHDTLNDLYKLKPDIKWPNDLNIDEKKICGILAETTETNKGLAVIVGIGINLTSKNIHPDLAHRATSIEQNTKLKSDKEKLLNSLTRFFVYFYEVLQGRNGAQTVRDEWAKRSSYFEGKSVRVTLGNGTLSGTTCGLEENGALRIKTDNEEIRIVQAGDIESLRNS